MFYVSKLIWKYYLSFHNYHFVKTYFWTEHLHVYVICVCIVKRKYQIAESKAVVGVDRALKALSKHIQKPY